MKGLATVGLVLVLVAGAQGQAGHGTRRLTGTVVDETGAPIAAAKVVLTLLEAETLQGGIPLTPKAERHETAVRETVSDKRGRWYFNGIATAKWEIRVSRPGYAGTRLECDLMRLARDPRIKVRLEKLKDGFYASDPALLEEANVLFGKGDYDRARSLYESYLAKDPGAVLVMLMIGDCWRKSGDRPRAIEAYRLAVESTSADPARQDGLAVALAKIGECHLDGGDQALALDFFRRSVSAMPGNMTVQAELGDLLFSMGREDEAVRHFRTAIEIAPGNALVHFRLGLVYLNLADYGHARTCFSKVLELDPNSDLARQSRGFLADLRDKEARLDHAGPFV